MALHGNWQILSRLNRLKLALSNICTVLRVSINSCLSLRVGAFAGLVKRVTVRQHDTWDDRVTMLFPL